MRKTLASSNDLLENLIQCAGGSEIAAEGFFDDHAGTVGGAGFFELLDDFAEKDRRNRQVVRGVLGVA